MNLPFPEAGIVSGNNTIISLRILFYFFCYRGDEVLKEASFICNLDMALTKLTSF